MSFKDLISHEGILKVLEELGYTKPTPVQIKTIPRTLEGIDLQVCAETGTGKTAAFLLPSLTRLDTPSPLPGRGPRIVVLVPTRELALQVANASIKYTKYFPRVKTVCIYGGAPFGGQIKDLSRPHEVLVATPGRLIDHLQEGRVDLSRVEVLILDEADKMLDIDFIEAVELIADHTPEDRQTLLFSATLKANELQTFKGLMKEAIQIQMEPLEVKEKNIDQQFFHAKNLDHKCALLGHLLNDDDSVKQAIVFTATKSQADELVDRLTEDGVNAAALHGGMRQEKRTRTIMRVRQGKVRILVATDVAARGIDIPALSHVINFDLPRTVEDYEHRIGRTGRAGAKGVAISFATSRDMRIIKMIENLTRKKITPQGSAEPAPRGKRSGGERNSSREDRPRERSFSDRPRQSFSNDRPRQAFSNDRPTKRSFSGDRPRQSFSEDRPKEREFSEPKARGNFFSEDRPKSKFSFNTDKPRGRFASEGDRGRPFGKAKPFENRGPKSKAFGGDRAKTFEPRAFKPSSEPRSKPRYR